MNRPDAPALRSMQRLRKHPKVTDLAKRTHGFITDLSGNHTVELFWNQNEAAKRDKIFKLKIDEKVVYLDLEELTFYTRLF